MKLTLDDVASRLGLDRQQYNCDRIAWETALDAGNRDDLDADIVKMRCIAIAEGLMRVANSIKTKEGLL